MTSSSVIDHQLVFVRSLFDRAIVAYREGSDLGLMQALLQADIAIETLNKHVIDKRSEGERELNAHQLVSEVRRKYPKLQKQPEIGAAGRLRRARNPIQHEGHVPAPAEVLRHLEDAAKYIDLVTRVVYGVSFAEVSSVSLVRTPYLKEALERAQKLLAQGNPELAIVDVAAVFKVLLIRADTWVRAATGKNLDLDKFRPIRVDGVLARVFGPDFSDWYPRVMLDDSDTQFACLSLKFSLAELCELQAAVRVADEIVDRDRREAEAKKKAAAAKEATDQEAGEAPDISVSGPTKSPFELKDGRTITREDIAGMVEILAQRLWHLESTDPELISSRHPSSPDFKRPTA